jgi:hypothetical protein
MKIVIDINKQYIIDKLQTGLVNLVFLIYSWFIHEGEILGYILAVFHILISITVFMFIIICHTIYPDFWLQVIVFTCLFFMRCDISRKGSYKKCVTICRSYEKFITIIQY